MSVIDHMAISEQIESLRALEDSVGWHIMCQILVEHQQAATGELINMASSGVREGHDSPHLDPMTQLLEIRTQAKLVILYQKLSTIPGEFADRLKESLDIQAEQSKTDAEMDEMRQRGEPIVPGGNV